MEFEKITLDALDYEEALRYIGQKEAADDKLLQLLQACEKKVLQEAIPRYLYKVVPIRPCEQGIEILDSNVILRGQDISRHLSGCSQAILLCATLSAGVDRLLRCAQKTDMAEALVMDALASVAVEQVGNKVRRVLEREFPECYVTWGYGVGYGDFPIQQQAELLGILDAARKIGVNLTRSNMLTPLKSINVVMGMAKAPKKQQKSCGNCVLKGNCRFRQEGIYCYDTANA